MRKTFLLIHGVPRRAGTTKFETTKKFTASARPVPLTSRTNDTTPRTWMASPWAACMVGGFEMELIVDPGGKESFRIRLHPPHVSNPTSRTNVCKHATCERIPRRILYIFPESTRSLSQDPNSGNSSGGLNRFWESPGLFPGQVLLSS
jgi:hypothetical protein